MKMKQNSILVFNHHLKPKKIVAKKVIMNKKIKKIIKIMLNLMDILKIKI